MTAPSETRKPHNGINGEIMLNTPDRGPGATGITIGSVPGKPYGYKRSLKVTVDIRMEQLAGAHETTEHQTIAGPLDFAITANVWKPNESDLVETGQVGDLLDHLDSHALDAEAARFLAKAADEWHLNAMRAACAHQDTTVPEGVTDIIGWRLDNIPPCEIDGYRYGSKWLIEPLTDEFVRDLLRILADPIKRRRIYVHPDLPGIVGVEEPFGGRD